MPKRVLAIGVGGTGKAALTILKERLEETYGKVPDTVVLLSLDTDDLRAADTFAGTRLIAGADSRGRESEFQHIVSPPGMNMDRVFAEMAAGRTMPYMFWLEQSKLARVLTQAEKDIRGGAQQRRPIGRVALYQRWNPIYQSIVQAISRIYGPTEEAPPAGVVDIEKNKRLIFIIGSVAGGTGSGFFIDVANLVRRAVKSNDNWQSVDVSAIIVLPDAFQTYTREMEDPTNLKPNSFAALREFDRFIRGHSAELPYMIRYGDDPSSITWSTNQPVDHVYLVDTASRDASGDMDLRGDPMRGPFPAIADFMAAHVDESLGDTLATLRSNAGQLYEGKSRPYSSFNVRSYILPINDIIESFSLRFLREMLNRQFLPITDKKARSVLEQAAATETEQLFSQTSVLGKVNPTIIQKAFAATRAINPESPDLSWRGLFNMIALSDSAFARDFADLDGWLTFLGETLTPTSEGEFKREKYDDGYTRLLRATSAFMDKSVGPLVDKDDEASRFNGEWDKILIRYRDALRVRMSEALDAALLDILNRRDPQNKVLEPGRLPFVRAVVATLKQTLLNFRNLLGEQYQRQNIETRIRQTGEQVRSAITWMRDTKDTKTFALIGKPEARKAQDAYIGYVLEQMELLLHQRIFRVVLDVLDALGAAERDSDGIPSVIDAAGLDLENWDITLKEVQDIYAEWTRNNERHREEKRQVKVRRYLTDKEFEDRLYQASEISGTVALRMLGQVKGEVGIAWRRLEETEPLKYKMVSMWSKEGAEGARQIAEEFFAGTKELFQGIREKVTIGERIATAFRNAPTLVNTVSLLNEPLLRYNPAANEGKSMSREQYISFNLARIPDDEARRLLEQTRATLGDQGFQIDSAAESNVVCTVVQISRGVALNAVDQFLACEPDYRQKIFRGRESLHLFPEEQQATEYEGRIQLLNEPNNQQRLLAPELVTVIGDADKLRAFTLGCAYGLIHPGTFFDAASRESREVFLTLRHNGDTQDILLSQSHVVRAVDQRFADVGPAEQLHRLYLNALQNFVLKITEKSGVAPQLIPTLRRSLEDLGVPLGTLENPFTLSLRTVNESIRRVTEDMGPSFNEQPDQKQRQAENNTRRIQRLRDWMRTELPGFKGSPLPAVRDMGTVMHLVLDSEIKALEP